MEVGFMLKRIFSILKKEEDFKIPELPESPPELSDEEKLEKHIKKLSGQFSLNLELVNKSLPHIKQSLQNAIASSSKDEEVTYTRLYTLLLGVWIECRLHKLIYEKGAFDESERKLIYTEKSIENRWYRALEVAFKKYRKISLDDELTNQNLGFTHFTIFNEMKNWLGEYIAPVATLRNKVAHGQWKFPFSNDTGNWLDSYNFKVNQDLISLYAKENYLTIECKFELVKLISVAINNMAVDAGKYETADFDGIQIKIQAKVDDLKSIDKAKYSNYKSHAQEGFKKKAASLKAKEQALIDKAKKEAREEIEKSFILTPR
ncbi:hypothetical protein Q6U60_004632 [Vibrio alginolyticus]|nr:hypothetical protein [Vibrio alginolyticus]ELA7821769.1 hypothetical protein [Vibrio alginolyticus]